MRMIDANKLKYDIYKHFYIKYGGCYIAGEVADIIDIQQTISNAAENETPESNECEYCSGEHMRPLDWLYGLNNVFPGYKYCPMCGRRVPVRRNRIEYGGSDAEKHRETKKSVS